MKALDFGFAAIFFLVVLLSANLKRTGKLVYRRSPVLCSIHIQVKRRVGGNR